MKNTPTPDTKALDIDLIKKASLLGVPLTGFDPSRVHEKQVIDSIFGKLTFDPDNQFRGGTLDFTSEDGKVTINLHYRTFKVVSVETTNDTGDGDEDEDLLSCEQIEPWTLIKLFSSLAREVLELRNQLTSMKQQSLDTK